MQKKKITAFLLALAMVSAMALPVFAQEPNPQTETAASIAVRSEEHTSELQSQ